MDWRGELYISKQILPDCLSIIKQLTLDLFVTDDTKFQHTEKCFPSLNKSKNV